MGRRAEAAGGELPAVDPDTGRLLAEDPPAGQGPPGRARPRRPPRVRRLRRAAAGLAALSVVSAGLAGWAADTVGDLRHVERSWLTAAAVDGERLATDRSIAAAVEPYGDPSRLGAEPLRQVAEAEAVHLRRLERELA
ncbi:MAG TPA: hypothetical protein VFO65_11940, partial [Acidimicrobiales bacterium]|nr:hypothetical protein [Acidimicrobiales bacterium]